MLKITQQGELVEALRKDLYGVDVEMIANRVGLSKSAIYAIRSGRTKWPRETTMLTLAHILGYSLWLMRDNEK